MPNELSRDGFTFGRFHVSPARRMLRIDGEPAKLGARAFDVLLALVERRDRLVSKNELMQIVWPNVVVEENNLQVQIHSLRKIFGPDVVATIPGRGYRFTAQLDGDQPGENRRRRSTDVGAPAAAATPAAPPTNLPAQPEPLYGRDDDVPAVRERVEAHRLVTITGAGGIGKTRLGEQVAHALRANFADGVWMVQLAPLVDGTLLPATVARTIELHLSGQKPAADELITALETKRMLLVLDNCEHLIDAASQFAQTLLDAAPGVRLLVTSQEPLRLPAEHVYRLGTLGVPQAPDPNAATPLRIDPAEVLRYGAVRLFAERAQAVEPRFVLDARNVGAVIDICRHLDGLALAIELAAARVPALGVEGVRERLGERLRMLTAGSRIALRRHQTLRAALDWSHALLDADEQAVFRRLGVFSGGCTLEAAQQVTADAERDDWAVLVILARLVDKSLVVANGDDRPRYHLLESARAYALEKLAAAGETDALQGSHAKRLAETFERLADALFAGRITEDEFVAARAADIDNLRGALAWALSADGDAEIALALLAHTAPLAFMMSAQESEAWLTALMRRIGDAPKTPRLAAWLSYIGIHWSARSIWLPGHALGKSDSHLLALRALDDERRQAHALNVLSCIAAVRGNFNEARVALDEATQVETPDWPAWLALQRLYFSLRLDYLSGEPAREVGKLPSILARLEADGDGEGNSAFMARTNLAEHDLLQGRLEEAASELLVLAELGRRQRRDAHRMCFVLMPLVYALTELGRLDEATQAAHEALPLLWQTGMIAGFAPTLALLVARRGNVEGAARLLGAGDAALGRVSGHRATLERSAYERAMGVLKGSATKERIEGWVAEGGVMGEEALVRLVGVEV